MQNKQLLQSMSTISRSTQDQVDGATINQPMNDNSVHGNNIHTILKQQTDLNEMLLKQKSMALLPTRKVSVYNGDPMSFITFMQAFEYNIENKTKNNKERLYYLEQLTSGQARDQVRSCMHMDSSSGYNQAKCLQQEYFGNDIRVTNAYIEKIQQWPNIKAEDCQALRSYVMYLRGCCNAMHELRYMRELDTAANLSVIIKCK